MKLRTLPVFFSHTFVSLVLGGVLVMGAVPVTGVEAAVWKGFDAELLNIQSPTSLVAGERGEVKVRFRNDGDKAWQVSSKDFVSLYAWDPTQKTEIASVLADTSWSAPVRPTKLPVTQVGKDGEVTLSFFIRAPKTAGVYSEEFILAAEDVAWLKDSRFKISFRVTGANTPTSAASGAASGSTSIATGSAQAFLEDASAPYTARVINSGGLSWNVEAGQDIKTQIAFQNTGGVPWEPTGAEGVRLVPLETDGRMRTSAFWHPTWTSKDSVAPLSGRVSLGGDATFSFSLRAPDTAGLYHERFALVTASGKQIKGAYVELPITVVAGSGFVATDISDIANEAASPSVPEPSLPAVQKPSTSNGLIASTYFGSGQEIELLGNGRKQIMIGWKNGGKMDWTKMGVRIVSSDPWVKASWLMDTTWSDNRPPEATVQVRPTETGFYSFYVKAPPKRGTYTLTFRLFANGQPVQNGDITVHVRATTDVAIPVDDVPKVTPKPTVPSTPSRPATPLTSSAPIQPAIEAQPLSGDPSTLPAEPMIRVGIYQPPHNRLQVTANVAPLEVRLQGSAICQVAKGQFVTIEYQKATAKYTLTGADSCNGTSAQPYVVRATDGVSSMEITDFVRPSTWVTNASDNDFRAQLELRASNDGKQLWVINELSAEYYLKGIAETSNISPAQFQRTLVVAARTYAMYHISRGTKHANENFLVDATFDQVYRGYAMELRAPRIAAAVDATRGQIVTYNGKLAITPYFSRSDGRTRSWGEVWNGGSQYPWLVGVPVPQDQGRVLWGHGVGMSAAGALDMANEGKTYDYILKYFYTGIELRRAYK